MIYKGVKINTIEEMEKLFYSSKGAALIQKDAPVLSTTTGVYNAVYGAEIWSQLNRESNAFGLLPKNTWDKSGWRVMTARPAASGGGVAENGAIPATIKPTFAEISAKPKTVAHTFDVSELQEFLASQSGDDATADMEVMRAIMGVHHKEMMNVMLCTSVDTLAGNNLESIDRVTSSYDEVTNCGITAGDADIYGLDRDAAASYADAQLSDGSGTNRILTDPILRAMIRNTIPNAGGNTTFCLTGHDTLSEIESLYQVQARYGRNDALSTSDMKLTVNGVETAKGINVGIKVTSIYGKPFFTTKNAITSGTGGTAISNIWLLDTSNPEGFSKPRLGLDVAKPTQYFEAGINMGNPFAIDRLGNEGMFRTMAELKCRFFAAQGKIRDLKSA